MNNEIKNTSGCTDKTSYEAMQNVRREERRNLIAELKSVAQNHGYMITSKIILKELPEVNNAKR